MESKTSQLSRMVNDGQNIYACTVFGMKEVSLELHLLQVS